MTTSYWATQPNHKSNREVAKTQRNHSPLKMGHKEELFQPLNMVQSHHNKHSLGEFRATLVLMSQLSIGRYTNKMD